MEKKIIHFVIERLLVEQEAASREKDGNFYGADLIREEFWWKNEEFDNFAKNCGSRVWEAYENLLHQCLNEAYSGTGFDTVIEKLKEAE